MYILVGIIVLKYELIWQWSSLHILDYFKKMNVTFSCVLWRFYSRAFHVIWDWKLTNIWRMPLSTRLYLFVSWTHSIKKIIHYGKSWLKVGLFSHLIKIQHYTESIVQYFCETCINCRQKTNCSVALASYSPFLSSDYKIYWRTINRLWYCGFTWSLTLFQGRGRDAMTAQGSGRIFLARGFSSSVPILSQDGDCGTAYSCHKLHEFLCLLSPEQNLQDLVLCIFPQWHQQTRLISPANKMVL